MKRKRFFRLALCISAFNLVAAGVAISQEEEEGEAPECFESREGKTAVTVEEINAPYYKAPVENVKCSERTGGVLWWSDPFYDTAPMGAMPVEADYTHEEAVVRPRIAVNFTVDAEMAAEVTDKTDKKALAMIGGKYPVTTQLYAGRAEVIAKKTGIPVKEANSRLKALEENGIFMKEYLSNLTYFMPCSMCHNGEDVKTPVDEKPRKPSEEFPHLDVAGLENIPTDPMSIKHGRGAIWCLDCHSRTNRDVLRDHRGNAIGFNEPQKLCGKCHGQILRDWRDGIHGKRIGEWTPGGKKRWWICTECHNPHDIQQGSRNSGFAQLNAEPAPELPKGMKNADHEKGHGHEGGHGDESHGAPAAH